MKGKFQRSLFIFFVFLIGVIVCLFKAIHLNASLFYASLILVVVGLVLGGLRYMFRYKNESTNQKKNKKYGLIAVLIFVIYIGIRSEIKHLIIDDMPTQYYGILIAFLIGGILIAKYGVKSYFLHKNMEKY